MKKLKIFAAALAACGAMSSANAFFLYPGITILEDDNREYLIKGEGNSNAGQLQVGDKLRGVITFQAIVQETGGGSQSPILPELTGIFETQIISITNVDANPLAAERIDFGVSSSFASAYGAGAMVALFTGGVALDINACGSIAACEAAATDGAAWMTAGFSDLDDQWYSRDSVLNFGSLGNLSGTSKVAFVNYALSILANNTGYQFAQQSMECAFTFTCAGDGMTDAVGSGDVLGGRGLGNGYGARSDIDVSFNVIPEPASVGLVGIALLGLAAASRRKTR